jgi:hypothetical protein
MMCASLARHEELQNATNLRADVSGHRVKRVRGEHVGSCVMTGHVLHHEFDHGIGVG